MFSGALAWSTSSRPASMPARCVPPKRYTHHLLCRYPPSRHTHHLLCRSPPPPRHTHHLLCRPPLPRDAHHVLSPPPPPPASHTRHPMRARQAAMADRPEGERRGGARERIALEAHSESRDRKTFPSRLRSGCGGACAVQDHAAHKAAPASRREFKRFLPFFADGADGAGIGNLFIR